MWLGVERGVEGKNRAGALEAVAGEVQLLHGVQVLDVHLDSRSVRCLAHPEVEILPLARLEEEDIVAVVQFGELVQLVEFGLGIELDVLAGVWEERVQIIEEMAMSVAPN